ncbi:LLM class flavin-dependent oxidoreductase [Mycobacterium sp.]|uniref:LLM class flavin-dependent oxidoreductase n=1 Tax=Mycobacterium sp. TaxID=1785 RepID=UPI003F945A1D
MTLSIMRFTFASPRGNPAMQRELLSAAIELAQWGDSRGLAAVSIDEHHVTGHGWSCNPIMAASMFLVRTSNLYASVDCALGPLWNPLRLAEDIAFVDAMSGGRLHTTVGLGYRRVEYEAVGTSFSQRGALMDRLIETVLRAWSGKPMVDGDPDSCIGAGTWSRPHPPLYVGGGVRASARRAARFGLGLSLPDHLPDIAQYYVDLCTEAGVEPVVIMPSRVNRGMIFLHEDPDKAWSDLGKHILWEAVTYGGWSQGVSHSLMHLPGVQTLEEVKASGRYRFLTPEQLITEVRDHPENGPIVLHPLVGGMPVDEAWSSVQLLTDKVLPHLA